MTRKREKVFRGDRLLAMRERLDISQDDFAARLGFGQAQINRYENGKGDPALDTIKRMAAELQVTTDWLLGLTNEPTEHFQPDDMTPEEWDLINAYRSADIETFMRRALERKKPSNEQPPGKAKPKKS